MRETHTQGKPPTRRLLAAVCLLLALAACLAAPRPAVSAQADSPTLVKLTASTLQTSLPAEALPRVAFHLGKGYDPGCLSQPRTPALRFVTAERDLTGIAVITSCGWQPNEVIRVTLMDPTGEITTTQVKAQPAPHNPAVYQAAIYYQPGVDMPAGKYRFTLEGSRATLKAKITFLPPARATLYALPPDPYQPLFAVTGGKQRLRLSGMLADEPLRLLAYTFDGSTMVFYGWQSMTASSRGDLIIETDLPGVASGVEMNYYVYGRDTHTVALERFTPDGLSLSRRYDMDVYCPGAQPARVSGGAELPGLLVQPAAPLQQIAVHQQPGFGSRVTAQAGQGRAVRIYGYAKCIDHAFWYPASLQGPILYGWVAESQLGRYLFEPVD